MLIATLAAARVRTDTGTRSVCHPYATKAAASISGHIWRAVRITVTTRARTAAESGHRGRLDGRRALDAFWPGFRWGGLGCGRRRPVRTTGTSCRGTGSALRRSSRRSHAEPRRRPAGRRSSPLGGHRTGRHRLRRGRPSCRRGTLDAARCHLGPPREGSLSRWHRLCPGNTTCASSPSTSRALATWPAAHGHFEIPVTFGDGKSESWHDADGSQQHRNGQ